MVLRNKLSVAFCGFIYLMELRYVQCLPVNAGDIGPGIYHATIVGTYAGKLAGGLALNGIKQNVAVIEKQDESEHDFSEGAAQDDPSLYESVGPKGDHLNEKYFPADLGREDQKDNQAQEYAEEESQSTASVHHEDIEANDDFEDHDHYESASRIQEIHENKIDLGSDNDNFYEQPVPGIDHGNGAYSYSTTYEFPKY